MPFLWFAAAILLLVPPWVPRKSSLAEVTEEHRRAVCGTSCGEWEGLIGTGISRLRALTGTGGLASGQMKLETGRDRFDLDFRVERADFPGEHFSYDGKETSVEFISPGLRSPFGAFVHLRSAIVKEGLLGGTYNPDWPLIDPERRGKLRYRGWKKKRGFHEFSYRLGWSASLGIRVYLDDEWNHTRTTYIVLMNRGAEEPMDIRSEPRAWAEDGQAIREELTETFSQFRSVGNLTMPTVWELEYSRQGIGQGRVWKWETRFSSLAPITVEERR